MSVIDTDVYVYRALKDSEYHEASKRVLRRVPKWFTPTIVLHELIWVLSELLSREEATDYVRALLFHEKVEVIPVVKLDVSSALRSIKSGEVPPSMYNDEIILSVAKRIGVALVTFDRQLITRASRTGVPVINPYLYAQP